MCLISFIWLSASILTLSPHLINTTYTNTVVPAAKTTAMYTSMTRRNYIRSICTCALLNFGLHAHIVFTYT